MLKKRLLSLLLSLLMVSSILAPTFAFPISFHQSIDSYTVDCNNQTVSVTAGKAYQSGYLLIRLGDSSGNIVRQVTASAKNEIELSVADLSDGIYYVEIFTGSSKTGTFTAYASGYNTLPIEIYEGIAMMVVSDNWVYNLGLFLSNRSDSFALTYYKETPTSKKLAAAAATITKGLTTDYDKIKAVHDWMVANIAYDYDHSDSKIKTDAEKVYSLRYTNAKGYANLAAALLRQCGISTKVVSGYAQTTDKPLTPDHKNAEAHHWNEAYDTASARWIIFDTCWDAANVYEDSTITYADGFDRYFDPTLEAFSTDHLLDQNEDTEGLKAAFDTAVKDVTVSFARTVLYTGDYNHTAKITVTLPDSLKDHVKVTYSSANKKKVSVSKAGKMTGVGTGKTTISVKISDGVNTYTVKESVRCNDPYLKFKQSTDSLKKGKTYTFKVGKYGVTGTVKWKVSDKTIATISSSGKLTAKKAGTVTVTAYIGSVKVTKKVKITS